MPYRPSLPLLTWRGRRRALLDGLAAGASSEALVEAYAVRVVAEFQAFARDLHTLGIDSLVAVAGSRRHTSVLAEATSAGRRLDVGTPSLDTLVKDFARLGLRDLVASLALVVPQWPSVRQEVAVLLHLRNAVAHGDSHRRDEAVLRGASVTVAWIGSARAHLDTLGEALDDLLWHSLRSTCGREPW